MTTSLFRIAAILVFLSALGACASTPPPAQPWYAGTQGVAD